MPESRRIPPHSDPARALRDPPVTLLPAAEPASDRSNPLSKKSGPRATSDIAAGAD